jgi:tetratricopeptide (TPR) repeat protein
MARTSHVLLTLALAASLTARAVSADDLKDLYFGEAIFEAAQGRYFEALERLDAELAQHRRVDEPERDTLHHHRATAEFDVGDFELDYRMHHRAGRAIKAVLEANVDDVIRNEAAFRLARIHFQKDQPEEALQALERIHGKVPEAIRDDLEFLRANVYLALGRPADAVPVLTKLQGAQNLQGFAAYNLGIAYLQAGRSPDAFQQLDQAGRIASRDPANAAIRDKSNMVLGRMMLESARFDRAQQSFDRVRLDGPYSNQALLSAGWADVSAGNFERALVPWRILIDRDTTDSAVQEARLALPFAYGKLSVHGRAAVLYGQALDSFGVELEKVDASIRSIREGSFLKALVREEIHQDQNWVVRLRTLPDAPETFYLTTLIASHDFQTALHNYLDLEDLHHKLLTWQGSFDAYDDLIQLRRANYEPLLPDIDAQFRELDSQMKLRVEQRDHLRKRLHDILTAPRPELLATADERIALQRIRSIEKAIGGVPENQRPELQKHVQRLKGVLIWTLRTEYPERLTQAHKNLRELQQSIDVLTARYQAFVRTRQAAVHSYVGYDQPILRLRTRVGAALQQVELLMAQQGTLIETVAINELKARGERLEAYQSQARYAVADSYDRATKAQARAAGELQ